MFGPSIASAGHDRGDVSFMAREADVMNNKARTDGSHNQGALLSEREEMVVGLLARGFTVSEIARDTGRSVKTVSQQKRNAMRKLGICRDQQLFQYLQRRGFAPLPN